jgi:hypothetical protein
MCCSSNVLITDLNVYASENNNYAGSENHSPHQLRKRSHFGTEYRKAPPPRKGKETSMGIKRLQAWLETGS